VRASNQPFPDGSRNRSFNTTATRSQCGRETKGFCKRFRTVKEKFSTALRKPEYASVRQVQNDLDEQIEFYNTVRSHQGLSDEMENGGSCISEEKTERAQEGVACRRRTPLGSAARVSAHLR
jgi:hypothetical protein